MKTPDFGQQRNAIDYLSCMNLIEHVCTFLCAVEMFAKQSLLLFMIAH